MCGRGESWALALTGILAVVSLGYCVLGLPEAAPGMAIKVMVLGVLAYVALIKPG